MNYRFLQKDAYCVKGHENIVCPSNLATGVGHNTEMMTITVTHIGINGRKTYSAKCICGSESRWLQYAKNVRK